MKKWVLINPFNNKIIAMEDKKEWVIRKVGQLQFSKKEIKQFKQGNLINFKFEKTYKKWINGQKENYTKKYNRQHLLERIEINLCVGG
ncbi:MAG: hypothetical protein ACOC1O_05270 [bacterium]